MSFFPSGWKDENGVRVAFWRMNLGVVTVNLPQLLKVRRGQKEVLANLCERMNIAEDAFGLPRGTYQEATPANAPILYQYGAFGGAAWASMTRQISSSVIAGRPFLLFISDYEVATVFMVQVEHNPEAKTSIDIIKDMARVEE